MCPGRGLSVASAFVVFALCSLPGRSVLGGDTFEMAMAIGPSDLVSAFRLATGEIETVDAFKYLGNFASSNATMQREIAQRL